MAKGVVLNFQENSLVKGGHGSAAERLFVHCVWVAAHFFERGLLA